MPYHRNHDMPRLTTACLLTLALLSAPLEAKDRKPPYWASISAGEARMRTGPSLTYPATWLYKRRDLPIRVLEIYPSWRKVQEPDGTVGWMLQGLLSDARTAIVLPGAARTMHVEPSETAAAAYRIAPGAIGGVSKCGNGWCRMDVKGRAGFIRTSDLWGVDPDEALD